MNPCAVPTEIKDINGDNRWMSVVSKLLLFKQRYRIQTGCIEIMNRNICLCSTIVSCLNAGKKIRTLYLSATVYLKRFNIRKPGICILLHYIASTLVFIKIKHKMFYGA